MQKKEQLVLQESWLIKMLKIKDNVDLKELEKFGFVKNDYSYFKSFGGLNMGLSVYTLKGYEYKLISLIDTSYKYDECENHKALSLLYDLIKADLVEKVVDKNE